MESGKKNWRREKGRGNGHAPSSFSLVYTKVQSPIPKPW